MSAGAIFQEALRLLVRQRLPEVAQRDVIVALEAGRSQTLDFLYEAGTDAGLPYERILTRAAAIYFIFCAGNVADDLSDAECTYFTDPVRVGPGVQLLLHTLGFHTLLEAALPPPALSAVTHEMLAALGPQQIEVRTSQWTASVFREVAEGIAGRQWSAYLQILWSGTPLADKAASVGMQAGIAAHVVHDIQSRDPRFTTLPEADRDEIVRWARTAIEALRRERLRCLALLLSGLEPVLRGAV